MGCYGIGISRILAASLEVLSSETELSWPTEIVPYQIMIIAPKGGSKEFAAYDQVMSLYDQLNSRDDFNVRFMSFGRVSLIVEIGVKICLFIYFFGLCPVKKKRTNHCGTILLQSQNLFYILKVP